MNDRVNDPDTTERPKDTSRTDRQTDTTTSERARVERGQVSRETTEEDGGFLPDDRMSDLRDRWNDVQAEFVDDPRRAVQDAQGLVRELVDELVETFRREREGLEGQWNNGGTADTEALRVTLQRYRIFFNRLLSQ